MADAARYEGGLIEAHPYDLEEVNRAKFNSYGNCIASFLNHPASPRATRLD
jgi:hypothetical protein